ncbi:MAG TPA: SIMPL domain-containing protein, partial [Vicinamibacteria bacterium]
MSQRTFALAMALSAATSLARAAEPPPREITTSGQGLVEAAPDEVVISAGVETAHAVLDEARRANEAEGRRLLVAIRRLGVSREDIQTETLHVYL